MSAESSQMIRVENLVKHFPKRGGIFNQVIAKVHAVNGLSLIHI